MNNTVVECQGCACSFQKDLKEQIEDLEGNLLTVRSFALSECGLSFRVRFSLLSIIGAKDDAEKIRAMARRAKLEQQQ